MAALFPEQENYVRMVLLLNGVSPRAVRALFDREFAPACLKTTLIEERNKLFDLRTKKIINQTQWKLLFPSCGYVESETFDVTLMICLIRHLTNCVHPSNGFESLPPPEEITPCADLARIKYYRNHIAHSNDTLDNSFFSKAWNEISGAIDRLGGPTMLQECNDLKNTILDQSNQNIIQGIQKRIDRIEYNMDILTNTQTDTNPWNVEGMEGFNSGSEFPESTHMSGESGKEQSRLLPLPRTRRDNSSADSGHTSGNSRFYEQRMNLADESDKEQSRLLPLPPIRRDNCSADLGKEQSRLLPLPPIRRDNCSADSGHTSGNSRFYEQRMNLADKSDKEQSRLLPLPRTRRDNCSADSGHTSGNSRFYEQRMNLADESDKEQSRLLPLPRTRRDNCSADSGHTSGNSRFYEQRMNLADESDKEQSRLLPLPRTRRDNCSADSGHTSGNSRFYELRMNLADESDKEQSRLLPLPRTRRDNCSADSGHTSGNSRFYEQRMNLADESGKEQSRLLPLPRTRRDNCSADSVTERRSQISQFCEQREHLPPISGIRRSSQKTRKQRKNSPRESEAVFKKCTNITLEFSGKTVCTRKIPHIYNQEQHAADSRFRKPLHNRKLPPISKRSPFLWR